MYLKYYIFAEDILCMSHRHVKILKLIHYFWVLRCFIYIVKSPYFEKSSVVKHQSLKYWSYKSLIMFKRLYGIRIYPYISISLGSNKYYMCMRFLKYLIFWYFWIIFVFRFSFFIWFYSELCCYFVRICQCRKNVIYTSQTYHKHITSEILPFQYITVKCFCSDFSYVS